MFPNLDEEPEAVLAGLGAGCRASRAEHGYTCFSHANGESSLALLGALIYRETWLSHLISVPQLRCLSWEH